MLRQAKTGFLWAGVVVAAALVTGQAAAGPLAIKCQVQVDVDGEPRKNWALYMQGFIRDPDTGELNASLRYDDPVTGEQGSGAAQLHHRGGSLLAPIGTAWVGTGSSGSGPVKQRNYKGGFELDPVTGNLKPVGSARGEVASLVTAGSTFQLQLRTFTMSGTCVQAEDP